MAKQTIAGLFPDAARGEAALRALHAAGFSSAQISELADDHDEAPKKLGNPFLDFFGDHTATGSDFQHNLTHLGMSADEAEYYEDGIARGGSLVTVKAGERADEALAILRRSGAAMAPDRTATGLGTGTGTGTGAGTLGERDAALAGEQTLQLRAERLAVEKTRVASGAVRIGKRVVSATETIDVPVTHDELVIERRAATGAVGGAIGDDATISVPLSRDEVRVAKETYATEEIDVGKRAVTGTERVSETVRREELVVESDATGATDDRRL